MTSTTTPPPTRGVSLRTRILAATVIVALIAVLATALAALQLVRSIDTTSARAELSVQVDRLASAKPATREAIIAGLSQLDNPGTLVVMVSAAGTVTGSVAVPRRVVLQLRAGRDVSTTLRSGTTSYLLEGRPTAQGGGVVALQDIGTVRTLTPTVLGRILLALAIGFVVAAVAAFFVARALAKPLVHLAAAARRMAAGQRNVSLTPSGIPEVGDVEAALGSLDSALVHSEGRQREFLLSISHELRTPLTAIRGYAEALGDGMVPADQLTEVGKTLEAEAARLTSFTTDLLALARLEADDFSLQPAEVDAVSVLTGAAAAWRAAATSGGVVVQVAASASLMVTADGARLRQVVDGLIENALRVSPPGSRVTLSAQSTGSAAVIDVADGGPGLTAEDAAHAFERGVLRERYRDARPVGSGLGLSIAARLIERMGGTISAHSSPGGGAVFRITIPC
ncbi:MAG TPA: HAMP domain-containing sensor histidine kinase [Pseudolysinimonas sp.]|nr:HAMP domain-containing sensor histidine kinase [Pseudolysinimonas sp.]